MSATRGQGAASPPFPSRRGPGRQASGRIEGAYLWRSKAATSMQGTDQDQEPWAQCLVSRAASYLSQWADYPVTLRPTLSPATCQLSLFLIIPDSNADLSLLFLLRTEMLGKRFCTDWPFSFSCESSMSKTKLERTQVGNWHDSSACSPSAPPGWWAQAVVVLRYGLCSELLVCVLNPVTSATWPAGPRREMPCAALPGCRKQTRNHATYPNSVSSLYPSQMYEWF